MTITLDTEFFATFALIIFFLLVLILGPGFFLAWLDWKTETERMRKLTGNPHEKVPFWKTGR